MSRRAEASRSIIAVFGWPLIVAIISAFGLITALVGDGFFDLLSWLGLGVPVVLCLIGLGTALGMWDN